MARVVKEHNERRKELLDVAQGLFYQNGYEKTSVADIIDVVGIAKGTFYHYFKSKEDLLDQIIRQQTVAIEAEIDIVVRNSKIAALEKFNTAWSNVGQYKAANKDVMIMIIKVLYADENVLLLSKMMKSRVETVAPKLSMIISQGVTEGVFDVDDPDYTAEMIIHLGTSLGEAFAMMLSQGQLDTECKERFLLKCRTYENAVSRILGAEEGLIHMFDRDTIGRFFEE